MFRNKRIDWLIDLQLRISDKHTKNLFVVCQSTWLDVSIDWTAETQQERIPRDAAMSIVSALSYVYSILNLLVSEFFRNFS